jgi:hypothetical protein
MGSLLRRHLGAGVTALAVAIGLVVPSVASAAGSFQYFDGILDPSSGDVWAEYPSGHDLTRSSARKVSGLSGACAAARNNDGTLVGSWACTYSDNGLAEHVYGAYSGRFAVCWHSNDGHAVNLRCQEDYA